MPVDALFRQAQSLKFKVLYLRNITSNTLSTSPAIAQYTSHTLKRLKYQIGINSFNKKLLLLLARLINLVNSVQVRNYIRSQAVNKKTEFSK